MNDEFLKWDFCDIDEMYLVHHVWVRYVHPNNTVCHYQILTCFSYYISGIVTQQQIFITLSQISTTCC